MYLRCYCIWRVCVFVQQNVCFSFHDGFCLARWFFIFSGVLPLFVFEPVYFHVMEKCLISQVILLDRIPLTDLYFQWPNRIRSCSLFCWSARDKLELDFPFQRAMFWSVVEDSIESFRNRDQFCPWMRKSSLDQAACDLVVNSFLFSPPFSPIPFQFFFPC